jgi:hypothetical protein
MKVTQRLLHFNKLLLPNLYIYLWPEKLQAFSEITMENDLWLLILRNHSQWKIVQWSKRSWKSCIHLVGSRNKLDHSKKNYKLLLWLCTIEHKDLIILVFASFPWHSTGFQLDFIILSSNDLTHSQWKIVQWSKRSWKSCIPVWKKIFITVFFFSKIVNVNLSKKKQ